MKEIKKLFFSKKFIIFFCLVILILGGISFYFSASHKTGGELVIDCAYFRKLSTFDNGSIYLFLKNDSKKPVTINRIILDDIPLPDLALSELFDEGDMSDIELAPSLKVEEDDRVLWYYVYPNPIPPGKTAKVIVKCNFSPYKLISIAAEDGRGKTYRSILQPENNPLRFTYIGFNKNFNKIYLYLENSSQELMKIARVYINGQDMTEDAFRPWEELNSNEKKCIEVNLKTPLIKGEFITAKVITTDGLATESMVRAFSFFPITTDSGNPVSDLNLDSENYIVSFAGDTSIFKDSNKDSNIIYNILNCPTHRHGSWQNAGRKTVGRTITCYDNDPYHLTYMGICKAVQEKGSFAFSEIPDAIKENPIESSTKGLELLEYSPRTTANILKDAVSPKPWFSIAPLIIDKRIINFQLRIPTSGETRFLVYNALSRGVKGIFYRLPDWQGHENLKDEVSKINQEIQLLKDYLIIAEPIPLASCNNPHVESCVLQAGYEGIILFLVNQDTKSTQKDFVFKDKTNISVKVKIPDGVRVENINEIIGGEITPFNSNSKDGEIILSIDKLNLTRQFLIKTTSLYEINKSQPLEVKEPKVIPITISGKETPEEILTEAKTVFDKMNSLKWYPRNLEEYDKVIKLANKVVSNSKDKIQILDAQRLIVDCYDKQAEYVKKGKAFEKYIKMVEKFQGLDKTAQEIVKVIHDTHFNRKEYFDAELYFKELLKKYHQKGNY